MEGTWSIDKMEGVTSFDPQSGEVTFESNTTEEDRIYTITYTDEMGGTGATIYRVPSCPEPQHCEEDWKLELNFYSTPYRQDYKGTGGTPIIASVKFNGEIVEGLTGDDFVLNIGQNGEYNEIFSGLEVFSAGENYGIRINKVSEEISCKYIGEELKCTLAPTACTEAKVEFYIIIDEKENWITYITGLPERAKTMSIAYCCELSICGRYVKLEFDDFEYNSSTGELYKTTPLYKNINPASLTVVSLSQLGGYNQAPYCIRVVDISSPNIRLHYCTDCTDTNPCNQNYENHCNDRSILELSDYTEVTEESDESNASEDTNNER